MRVSLSIRSKLFLSILLILVVSYTTLLLTTFQGIEDHIEQDVTNGLEEHLNYVHSQFLSRAEQTKYSLLQPIMAPPVQQHLKGQDIPWLKDALRRWNKVLPFVDSLTIVDPQGRVITRLNGIQHGGQFAVPAIVEQIFREKKALISTELVGNEFLRTEQDPASKETEAMVVLVAIPVITPDGTLLGG